MLYSLAVVLMCLQQRSWAARQCNIRIVDLDEESEVINLESYVEELGPTVWRSRASRNAILAEQLNRETLLAEHGDAQVILSSSNSYSHDTLTTSLRDYILTTVDRDDLATSRANETYYMFGHNDRQPPFKRLNENYIIPPCGPLCEGRGTKTLGVGGRGSGTSWHLHGPAFSEVLLGAKRWLIYPKGSEPDMQLAANKTMSKWIQEVLPLLPDKEKASIWDCIIEPGDMLYFPLGLYHATLNMDRYNAFVSYFV